VEFLIKHLKLVGLRKGADLDYETYARNRKTDVVCFRIKNRAWVDFLFAEYGSNYQDGYDHHTAAAARAARLAQELPVEDPSAGSGKWLPPWCFKLDRLAAAQILCGLAEAGGVSPSAGRSAVSNRISTSHPHFRDQVARLATHAGYIVHATCLYRAGAVRRSAVAATETEPARSAIVAKRDNWNLHFSAPGAKNATAKAVINKTCITKVEGYSAGSYCVTMPSGNIVVRRVGDGKIYQTMMIGNCPGHLRTRHAETGAILKERRAILEAAKPPMSSM
jgi:hypothetical protein